MDIEAIQKGGTNNSGIFGNAKNTTNWTISTELTAGIRHYRLSTNKQSFVMSDKKKREKKLTHNFWLLEFFYFDESPFFFGCRTFDYL